MTDLINETSHYGEFEGTKEGYKRQPARSGHAPYLTLKNNTYYFRQGVPAELRHIIGRREIKKSLGQNYPAAVRECKRFALIADNQIAEARTHLDSIPVDPFSREGIRRTRFVTLNAVTPELEAQVGNLVRASLLDTDRRKRIAGMTPEEFDEYSFNSAVTTLSFGVIAISG